MVYPEKSCIGMSHSAMAHNLLYQVLKEMAYAYR